MSKSTSIKLRAKAKKLFREYEAIRVLINSMTVSDRALFKKTEENLRRANEPQLRRFISETRQLQAHAEFGRQFLHREQLLLLHAPYFLPIPRSHALTIPV
jgi:hypothetical protein